MRTSEHEMPEVPRIDPRRTSNNTPSQLRGVEGCLVCLGRLIEASYLPHVLQRSGVYLLLGCRWFEVKKHPDVPTHRTRPPDQVTNYMTRSLSVCLLCNRRWIRPSNSLDTPLLVHVDATPRSPNQAPGANCQSVLQIMIRKMWIGHRVRVPVFPVNRRMTDGARTRDLRSHK